MKKSIFEIPVIGPLARKINRRLFSPYPGSEEYWKNRYDSGGNSGRGSHDHLAEFKAEVVNQFVKDRQIATVIEYGCGDGHQLGLAEYPNYIGFDISPTAITSCKQKFKNDPSKIFRLMNEYDGETSQLTLSLDVIFHLTEDDVYNSYMERLFTSSESFVIVYSSNTDINPPGQADHVQHRIFTEWVEMNKPDWKLLLHIPNRYPLKRGDGEGAFSEFFIFKKNISA
jgi:SAM-dependent methyltransferase